MGYRSVELLGEPDCCSLSDLKRVLRENALAVSALTASCRVNTGRDLSAPDPETRQNTVRHIHRCLEFAYSLGCPSVGVTVAAVGRREFYSTSTEERELARDGLHRCVPYAERLGLHLAVEVLNRYVNPFANTVEDMLCLLKPLRSSSVGLALDLFHMNIEEANLSEAIVHAGAQLLNVHVADSNRRGVGHGHLDWGSILGSLLDIQYEGALALETAVCEEQQRHLVASDPIDVWQYAEQFLAFMPRIESAVHEIRPPKVTAHSLLHSQPSSN